MAQILIDCRKLRAIFTCNWGTTGARVFSKCSHRVATWPVRLFAGKYSAVEPPSAASSVVASSLPGISKEDQEILAMLEDGDDDRYAVRRAI